MLEIRAHTQRGKFQLDVEVNIPHQGITAVLGPSGSGKSTLLRLLAGLEQLQRGRIRYADKVWADASQGCHLPPQHRHIGMVFQDYALFAHMTVAQNIAYGIASTHSDSRIAHCIQRLHLDSLADRYPSQLSGGQRQRVALARALITQPSLLLLDEPFSAIDSNLRQSLRRQLKSSVAEVNCPVLLVTHYLEDVHYLADYIGVMADGQMLQFGHKQEVLHRPNCKRVAELVGWQNFIPIHGLTREDVYGEWGKYTLPVEPNVDAAWLAIRAEHIELLPDTANSGFAAEVTELFELGMTQVIVCRLCDGTTVHKYQSLNAPIPEPGDKVRMLLSQEHLRVLPDRLSEGYKHRAPLHIVKSPTSSANTTGFVTPSDPQLGNA